VGQLFPSHARGPARNVRRVSRTRRSVHRADVECRTEHGEAIGSYRGDPLYHASLDPAEYATLLKGIGFKIVAHVLNDLQAGGRTVWLAQASE